MNEPADVGNPGGPQPPAVVASGGAWMRLGIVLLVVGALVFFLARKGGWFVAIRLEPQRLLPLALLEGALLVLRGLLSRDICARFEAKLGIGEATALAAWAGLANYVTPFVGGTGLRALYLQRRYRLPLASFLSVQAATYILHFAVASVAGLVALALLDQIAAPLRLALVALFVGLLLACGLALRWPLSLPRGEGRLISGLRRALEGWICLRQGSLVSLWGLLILNILLQAIATHLVFAAVGVVVGGPGAVLLAAVYSISILLAVTPAALGVSEGAILVAAAGLGLGAPAGLAAAALRRGVALAVTVLVAALGSLRGPASRA